MIAPLILVTAPLLTRGLSLSAVAPGFATPILISAAVTILLFLAIIFAFLYHSRTGGRERDLAPQARNSSGEINLEGMKPTAARPVVPTMAPPAARVDLQTAPTDPAPPSSNHSGGPTLAARALEAEESGKFLKAADLWRRAGDLLSECRTLRRTERVDRLAEVEFSLGMHARALESSREAMERAPGEIGLRARYVEALLDEGRVEEARAIAGLLLEPGTPLNASADELLRFARAFENVGQNIEAARYYHAATVIDVAKGDASIRLVYLRQLERLLPQEEKDQPFDILVGHLVLGGYDYEARAHSVRSLTSYSSRFTLSRLLQESENSATFEAVDRLLDSPIIVKLLRVPEVKDFAALATRMRAFAALNHPNLAKLLCAERRGHVLTVMTELQSGGSLKDLAERLDRIGLPLAVRILTQICSAMAAIHQHGLVHGNLTASNVLMGHDQIVKLADFAPLPPNPSADEVLEYVANNSNLPAGASADFLAFVALARDLSKKLILPPNLRADEEDQDPIERLERLLDRVGRDGELASFTQVGAALTQLLDASMRKSTPRAAWGKN